MDSRPELEPVPVVARGRARVRVVEAGLLTGCRRALGSTPAVPAARALSLFGEHAGGWLLLGAAGWASGRHRDQWARGAAGVLLAHGAAVGVKRLVRRHRPRVPGAPPLVGTPSELSFPSAHAASTAAAAVGYAAMIGRPAAVTALGAMAVSRVLLGVHWPSDVVAGSLLGGGVAGGLRRWSAARAPGRDREHRGRVVRAD